jgi:Xaa-Pro aminopeptidase
MKRLIFIFLSIVSGISLQAQNFDHYRYDNDLLPVEFHRGRRELFRASMPENSVAIIFSNPERNRSNDDDFQYHQDPGFYYLSGFEEPNSALVIFKNKTLVNGENTDEILFVQPRDPEKETWTGRRAGIEGTASYLGISSVRLSSDFASLDVDFSKLTKLMYLIPRGVVDDKSESADLYDLIDSFKKKVGFPPGNGDARMAASILAEMREIKTTEELKLVRKAVNMSCQGHQEMMRTTRPGMFEYQVQAVGEYVFKKGGSEYVAYASICGGGENSTILHYASNRKDLSNGDLIVLDMGAEYHGYAADITRTLPVSGHFTPEQKIIYELVLKAQQAGTDACKPGNAFNDPHRAAVEVIRKGLVELGIITKESDYIKYFMHGTSHYLGLDVHDAGTRGPLKSGNVITVEPGIYIPDGSPCDPKWWNIGIRIEDDILITETGSENLSESVPRGVAEIEKMMKESPVFIR